MSKRRAGLNNLDKSTVYWIGIVTHPLNDGCCLGRLDETARNKVHGCTNSSAKDGWYFKRQRDSESGQDLEEWGKTYGAVHQRMKFCGRSIRDLPNR